MKILSQRMPQAEKSNAFHRAILLSNVGDYTGHLTFGVRYKSDLK